MANGLLITMPNKQAHAALSILKESRILAPDVTDERETFCYKFLLFMRTNLKLKFALIGVLSSHC